MENVRNNPQAPAHSCDCKHGCYHWNELVLDGEDVLVHGLNGTFEWGLAPDKGRSVGNRWLQVF